MDGVAFHLTALGILHPVTDSGNTASPQSRSPLFVKIGAQLFAGG